MSLRLEELCFCVIWTWYFIIWRIRSKLDWFFKLYVYRKPLRCTFIFVINNFHLSPSQINYKPIDGVVVRASASQSVDLGFISLVESYRKTLKNGIYSFPAWRSAFMGGCGEQAGKFACCVLGQGT